jgi:hypothetical protein
LAFCAFFFFSGLNTCIGEANYKAFFRTMVYIFCMELAHFMIQIGLIIDIFIGGPTKDRADDWFHAGTFEFVTAMLIFFLVFNSISIFLIGQLLWFHSGLQRENLTTYKYIVRDHQRKRDKMRLEGEIMQLRHTEMARAKQQGNNLAAFRLEKGDQCRQAGCISCDPLNVPIVDTGETDPENGFGGALGPSLSHDNGVKSMDILPLPIESKEQENGNGAGGVSFIRVNNQDAPAEPKVQENGHGVPSTDPVADQEAAPNPDELANGSKEQKEPDYAPAEPKIQENGNGIPSTDPVEETTDREEPKVQENGHDAPSTDPVAETTDREEPKVQENGHDAPSTDPVAETTDREVGSKPDELVANGSESPTEVEAPVSNGDKDSTFDTKS